jgi:trehalose 6-phosphate phosphatase
MTENFFTLESHGEVLHLLTKKPRIIAFDFDGTLVPIAASPSEVVFSEKLRNQLLKLTGDKKTTVAIVSGRTHEYLEQMIGISSIIYYGNHGMTCSIKGFGASEKEIRSWSEKALEIYNSIALLEKSFDGCIIENKGPIVSVHYRNVDDQHTADILAAVESTAAKFKIDIQNGKRVIEFRPRTDFNKGTALSEIASKNSTGWKTGDPFLFAGDDKTDEDGFMVMKNFGNKAFGFKVGDGETSADFRLADGEISKFIGMII